MSNGDDDLKSAIDQCKHSLPTLIDDTDAKLDDALAARQSDLALKLRDQLRQLSDAFSTILNSTAHRNRFLGSNAESHSRLYGHQ